MTTPHVPTPLGPSRFGSHYLGQFRECPAKHYFATMAPHADSPTSMGLATFTTASPFLVGAGVHEGLAAWYRSRCVTGADNGVPDLDAAIAAVESHFALRRTEFADDATYVTDLAQATRLVSDYHDFYGPSGTLAEFPDLQIIVDAAGPIVERELALDLAPGMTFTARIDALCAYQGRTYTLEHKTSSPYTLGKLFTMMGLSTQALGQHTLLHATYPDHRPEGVLVNALIKRLPSPPRARPDRSPFERAIVTFTDSLDGRKFRLDAILTLGQIDHARALYDYTCAANPDQSPFESAREVYEQRGRSTGACFGYSRCPYLDLCRNPGREWPITRSFRPRLMEPIDPHTPTENDLA